MSTATGARPYPPRLSPFIFPSDTDFRFVLLIISVLGASLFIYRSLTNALRRPEFSRVMLDCFDPSTPVYEACIEPFEQSQAGWITIGVFILLLAAGAIYWIIPRLKIRRERLVPFSPADDPDLMAYLDQLGQETGLSRHPTFLLDAPNPATSGLAFGRLGRYYVVLNGGLVTQFYTNRPTFRAIVLHELAHLKNADIDKTYFSMAVWYAFVGVAVAPFAISLVIELARFGLSELGFVFSVAWRTGILAAFVYLIRNAVLRARESYADVRASEWDGPAGGLARALTTLPPLPGGWSALWQTHPQPHERCRTLIETHRLLWLGFWDVFGAGIAVAIAFSNLVSWLTLWLPSSQENLAYLGTVLLFGPLSVGVVGLGIWRNTFRSLALSETPRGAGRLGLGLGLGLILGQSLSFATAVAIWPADLAELTTTLGSHLVWSVLLMMSLFFFAQWLADGAAVWLEAVATHRALRLACILGLVTAAGILTLILGAIFFLSGILEIFVSFLLAHPLGAISQIFDSPLILATLVSLWAFPLSAWFWHKGAGRTVDLSWAFLKPTPQPVKLSRQPLLRPRLATLLGLAAGLLFCILMAVILVGLHLGLPDSTRSTDEAKNFFLMTELILTVLIQLGIAVVTAVWTRRLGWAHGMHAAFVSGCVMTIGALGLVQLGYCVEIFSFGPGHTCSERVDGSLASFFFGYIVNWGALLALPIAVFASTTAGWLRRVWFRCLCYFQKCGIVH